ncbi:MAG: ABC transporter permease, partial [Gammaproteobacteria bacterium]|nr:ABC transporter permease [Gammaproteobacteria bacterium]
MSIIALDLSPVQFMNQLKGAVGIDDFLVGVVKAPVHAYIIAMVGCFEGLRVARTAESVGRQTTL